jgi:hypothetical protein
MANATIRVKGLKELDRAFKAMDKELQKELRAELKQAAEPVRDLAEQKATAGIRNIGPQWGQMKLGVTARSVYVAPKARRHGGSPRPNVGLLLMEKAMFPALDENEEKVERGVEELIDRLARKNGF